VEYRTQYRNHQYVYTVEVMVVFYALQYEWEREAVAYISLEINRELKRQRQLSFSTASLQAEKKEYLF